jgi:CRISPR system Cascade subunit CasB
MTAETTELRLITRLLELTENRAALADLRRGLGQPRSIAPEMHRHVVPLLPENVGRWREQCHYLIAALFALHPVHTATGNLGDHFARAAQVTGNPEAVERRFVALLDAHPDDLDFHLRQAVSFLKSKEETPINWQRLYFDAWAWQDEARRAEVQRQWANGFWRRRA